MAKDTDWVLGSSYLVGVESQWEKTRVQGILLKRGDGYIYNFACLKL